MTDADLTNDAEPVAAQSTVASTRSREKFHTDTKAADPMPCKRKVAFK
jgi:hypothetical protein